MWQDQGRNVKTEFAFDLDPTRVVPCLCHVKIKRKTCMKRIYSTPVALLFAAVLAFLALPSLRAQQPPVKVWEEKIVIPTYAIGEPEPNPIFNLGRNSQGAQGIVYPYPLYDSLTHKKADKAYKIVYLENQYIKIGVLPETRRTSLRRRRQDQQLRLHLPAARHQARAHRPHRGLDLRRHRVEHSPPSSRHHRSSRAISH